MYCNNKKQTDECSLHIHRSVFYYYASVKKMFALRTSKNRLKFYYLKNKS